MTNGAVAQLAEHEDGRSRPGPSIEGVGSRPAGSTTKEKAMTRKLVLSKLKNIVAHPESVNLHLFISLAAGALILTILYFPYPPDDRGVR